MKLKKGVGEPRSTELHGEESDAGEGNLGPSARKELSEHLSVPFKGQLVDLT